MICAGPSTLPAIITHLLRFLSVIPAKGDGSGDLELGDVESVAESDGVVGIDMSTIHLSRFEMLPLDVARLADAGRMICSPI